MTLKWATTILALGLLAACGPNIISGTTIGVDRGGGNADETFQALDHAIKALGFKRYTETQKGKESLSPVTGKRTRVIEGYRLPDASPLIGATIYRQQNAGFEVAIFEGNRELSPRTCRLYEELLSSLQEEFGPEQIHVFFDGTCETTR